MTFTFTWSHETSDQHWVGAATCNGCGKPICLTLTAARSYVNSPVDFYGEITTLFRVNGCWPNRTKPEAPIHTPPSVAKRFIEGEDAFMRRNWNSAVAMYRSTLDIATKGMTEVDPNATFYARLKLLHDNHRITPDIKDWADHVRVEGNAALHEPDEFDEADAKALRFFTEMFLRYVYELPGKVREFRGEPDPAGGKM